MIIYGNILFNLQGKDIKLVIWVLSFLIYIQIR
jgi:hypothetical protein